MYDYLLNRIINHKMCPHHSVFFCTLQDLVSQPRTEVVAPTVEEQSLNHRTTRNASVPHYSKIRKLNGVIN